MDEDTFDPDTCGRPTETRALVILSPASKQSRETVQYPSRESMLSQHLTTLTSHSIETSRTYDIYDILILQLSAQFRTKVALTVSANLCSAPCQQFPCHMQFTVALGPPKRFLSSPYRCVSHPSYKYLNFPLRANASDKF